MTDLLHKYSRIGSALLAAALMAVAYSYYIEPQRLVVNETEIRIRRWNPALDGLRIACIGDIHAGSHGADAVKLRQVVEETNRQQPDMVVLLGDYISRDESSPSGLAMDPPDIARSLAGLKAEYGVHVVLGNHDRGAIAGELKREFAAVGFNVLDGKLAVLDINGARLRLLGLKDHMHIGIWKLYSEDAKAMLASTEGQGDVVVLQHSPDILPVITGDYAISNDLKLMLAAHTHGGQVWLPVVGAPIVSSGYGQKYRAGHITNAELDMFVTTGIGTSILPFRFMVPPEIAIVTIRAE